MEAPATNHLPDPCQERITSLELLVEQQKARIRALEEVLAAREEFDLRQSDFLTAQDALLHAREVLIGRQKALIEGLKHELAIWQRNVTGRRSPANMA